MGAVFPIENIKFTFRRWPALAVSLSVTCISFVLLFCFAAAGWPGNVASNCYEDYLVTPDCFCEKLRGEKPGDVWIAQPVNTITNLWFIVVGLLIAYSSDTKRLPSKDWWEKNNNLMTQEKMYSVVYALNSCLLGVGSSFLHASFTTWGRQLDMIAMYLIGTFLVLYPLLRDGRLTRSQAIWTYCTTNLYLIYWAVFVATPDETRKLFTTFIVSSWAIEIFTVDSGWARQNQNPRKIFFANLVVFCLATLQWKASESGGPLCYPESIFQGHSLWHFQSAMGIGAVYFYYLGEKGTPPPKRFILENPESMKDGVANRKESGMCAHSVSTSASDDESFDLAGSEFSQERSY